MPFGRVAMPAPPSRRGMPIIGAAVLLFLPLQVVSAQNASNGKNITKDVQEHVTVALPSLNPLVERVSPAVVNISAQISGEQATMPDRSAEEPGLPGSPFDELLRRFFENRGQPHPGREAMALGSGFIIDPSGYIVTNNHVAGNSAKITVILQDNSRHPAKVIGRDEKTD